MSLACVVDGKRDVTNLHTACPTDTHLLNALLLLDGSTLSLFFSAALVDKCALKLLEPLIIALKLCPIFALCAFAF
jgi:hypothetical protein